MRGRLFALLMLVVGAGALVGCGPRDHINPEYGERNAAFFTAQHVFEQPATGNPSGLEAEEAALIHANYRKSIGGKEAGRGQQASQVLILQEPSKIKRR